jgi:hypothetical protein
MLDGEPKILVPPLDGKPVAVVSSALLAEIHRLVSISCD